MTEPSAPPAPPEAEIIAGMLASLDAAGTAGLSEAKLLSGGRARRHGQAEALGRLDRGRLAVMWRKGRSILWFAARHAPSVEAVVTALREKAVPRGAVAWKAADLNRLLMPVQRDLLHEALSLMLKDGEVWELRAANGKGCLWLFPKSLHLGNRHFPQPVARDPAEALQSAYAAWRRQSGSSLMAIADLQAASGVPLPGLHEWLRAEAAAGRAELSEGDWSLASPDMRAAALSLQGQKFIRVRLQERV